MLVWIKLQFNEHLVVMSSEAAPQAQVY